MAQSRPLSSARRWALPPVVERELRAGSRRPLFFWLRGLLALALGFQGYELLERFSIAPSRIAPGIAVAPVTRVLPGADVLHHMAWFLFLAILLMGFVSAESINRERREGTLGLLLLTDLTPGQIVRGKLLSCGLTSFAVLLGALPALMIPVLAGGVRGSEAALTGAGLLNALFVVLAAGLWMSGVFAERRHAVAATLGLVAALAFGPEVLGAAVFGAYTAPLFRGFGLAGWTWMSQLPTRLSPLFAVWFMVMHALGWLFLGLAAAALARTWQDQPHKQIREPEPVDGWEEETAEGDEAAESGRRAAECAPYPTADASLRTSWLTDPRPWDYDPVRWRVEQLGTPEGLLWLAVGLNFFAQFGAFGSGSTGDRWGLLSFVSMAVIAASGGLVAWIGARFFQSSRRQQDLELLLTTPLGAGNMLIGQWRVLRRVLAWPIGVMLALALPAGISLLYDFLYGVGDESWQLLQPFLIAVNLAVELVALCWAGMWFGWRCRNAITSVTAAVGLVQLVPLALAAGLMWAWVSLPSRGSSLARFRGDVPPEVLALLFFLMKNVCLIAWARWRLRGELRLRKRPTGKAPITTRPNSHLPRTAVSRGEVSSA